MPICEVLAGLIILGLMSSTIDEAVRDYFAFFISIFPQFNCPQQDISGRARFTMPVCNVFLGGLIVPRLMSASTPPLPLP